MKTISQAAKEYAENMEIDPPIISANNAFVQGAQWAQKWISAEGESPEPLEIILLKVITGNDREEKYDIGYVDYAGKYYPSVFGINAIVIAWRPISYEL